MKDIRDSTRKIINGWIVKMSDGRAYIFHLDNTLTDASHLAHERARYDGRRSQPVSIFRNVYVGEHHRPRRAA